MSLTCSLYTNGRWHDADDGATFTRSHPLNAEAASTAAAASLADARRSVE
ncbi:salicylaldehyde dehydrogenase, partial [Raoultella sp. Ech2A]|nr:salicylaldehyde dehydrogenase [Raoultella sp. Ech2A]